jgi:hypothetical protein
MPPWRRWLALIAILAIFALSIDRQLLILPFLNRAPLAMAFAQRADRLWPQFPRFLDGVRAHTQNGDSIALVAPTFDWDSGYSYAYYRASYFLSGREVLPLIDADDRKHPENFRAAKYIAVWRTRVTPSGTAVWAGDGGVLTRHR